MKENRKEHRQDFCYNKKEFSEEFCNVKKRMIQLSLLALGLTLTPVHAEVSGRALITADSRIGEIVRQDAPRFEDGTAYLEEDADFPQIKSDFVYMVDMDTGQVMIDKGSEDQIYPASMTKMMTLLVAIENAPALDSTMTLGPEVFAGLAEAHASVAGFKQGETVSVKDLLYGLFLPSGADAAQALALEEAGSETAFVGLMNEKAAELGMTGTHFVNTSGLHDPDHYTTLRDLETLMRYALENPTFNEIFQTRRYTATPSLHTGGLVWESTLFAKISSTDPAKIDNDSILGGKTGYTNPAGLCLASIAEKNGTRYMLITAHAPVSNTPYHILDADHIYDYFYDHYSKQTVLTADQTLLETKVPFVLFNDKLTLKAGTDVVLNLPNGYDLSALQIETRLDGELQAPIEEGQRLGMATITRTDTETPQELARIELTSPRRYQRSALLYGFHQFQEWVKAHTVFFGLVVLGLILCLILIRDYRREQRRYKSARKKRKRRPHL